MLVEDARLRLPRLGGILLEISCGNSASQTLLTSTLFTNPSYSSTTFRTIAPGIEQKLSNLRPFPSGQSPRLSASARLARVALDFRALKGLGEIESLGRITGERKQRSIGFVSSY